MRMIPEYSHVGDDLAQKCTIISVVPFPIVEEKPGLQPGHFEIEASTDGKPRVMLVPECTHYVWIDEVRGSLRIVNPSYLVAQSIVNDYKSSQLEAGPDAFPGIFWVPGHFTAEVVVEKFADRIEEMRRVQMNWFIQLVRVADDDWQKTRQHISISDLQRFAAKAIDPENKQGRPWVFTNKMLIEANTPETTLCPACGSDIVRGVVLCRYCSFVLDPERYAQMQFAKGAAQSVASAAIQSALRQ